MALPVLQGMEFGEDELYILGPSDKSKVGLKLRKSLYGLKLAGRLGAQLLYSTLGKLEVAQCYTDSCLYLQGDE